MEVSKSSLKSRARMVVRTVFRIKRRRLSNTSPNSSLKLRKGSVLENSLSNKVTRTTCSKETMLSDKTKVKHLIRRFNANKESISVDNIQKARKEEVNEKLQLLISENDRLKKKIKNQKRQIEDLKGQLNSERSVYEGKIEYLNTLSDKCCSSKLQESTSSKCVAIQTYNVLDFDYFPFESDHVELNQMEEIKHQLHKQMLVTKCVCSKYIKLKAFKDTLMEKMMKSDIFYKKFISEIMQNFEECRISFALARSDSLEKGTVDHVLEKNARLAYNNAAMQLELFRFEKEINSLTCTTVPPNCSEEDFAVIKAVKAKTNEYSIERRSSSIRSSSSFSRNKFAKLDQPHLDPGSQRSMPNHQISVCGTVISVPVTVVDNGRITYRMTPMFEKVNDLQKCSQQPISITIKRSLTKMSECNPDLIVPSQKINEQSSTSHCESRTNTSTIGLDQNL